MRIQFGLVRASGAAATLALMVGGCALADESDPSKVQEGATEAFEFAPEAAAAPTSKEAADDSLAEKGTVTRKRGAIAHVALTISGSDHLICETANNTGDPMMAIIRCEGNTFCWPDEHAEYEANQKFATLALDDDGGPGINSRVEIDANNDTKNIYVVAFAYDNSIGYADINCTVNGATVVSGNYSLRGGSARNYSCGGGSAHTTGGWDPMILAIDPAINGGSGRMNDDQDYDTDRESHLHDLNSGPMYYVFNGYNEGDTTLNCP